MNEFSAHVIMALSRWIYYITVNPFTGSTLPLTSKIVWR